MEFATRTIHSEQPSEPGTGSLVAPIFQTSTYEQEAPGIHQGFDYTTRIWWPTFSTVWQRLKAPVRTIAWSSRCDAAGQVKGAQASAL
jgi:cystathionine gamma-lyase/cystathionine beta-lyase